MKKADKINALNVAVGITKEFCRGGGDSSLNPDEMLELLYRKLNKLTEDANTEEK